MSEIIKPSRRSFITGLTSLIVAPAIVRVESLIPVKVVKQFTSNDFKSMLLNQHLINMNYLVQAQLYGQLLLETRCTKYGLINTIIPNEEIYVKTN